MRWYQIAKRAPWEHLADTRKDFPHADLAGDRTVFNIGGNKYRLIVSVNYQWKAIFIKEVLTHRDYSRRLE
jgi:mRNA interferase HigB